MLHMANGKPAYIHTQLRMYNYIGKYICIHILLTNLQQTEDHSLLYTLVQKMADQMVPVR